MKTRAPPGREGSMERTKDFYNGMNYELLSDSNIEKALETMRG